MRFIGTVALALLLLSVEAVAVKTFGFQVTRIDVTLALVVFLGLRAHTVEGAFSAFTVGYLLDVFTGRPTGLFPFLSVLTFLVVRLAGNFVDARARGLYAILTGGATFLHGLIAFLLTWLTSREGGGVASLTGLPLQAVLTALAAFVLWPVLKKLDPGQDRPEPGVLR